jgi:hypothetical protein
MRLDEWLPIAAVLENGWRHAGEPWDDAKANAYFVLLADFDAAEVERALHLLVRNGSPFVPAVAEIVTAIESGRRAGVPTWPEALGLIRKAIVRHGRTGQDRGVAMLSDAHPLVASFAATYGWSRLCGEPIDDPDHGGAVLRRLEVAYTEHVERMRDRERQGIAIEAVSRRSLSGPRKLDAAALLPGGAR